MTPSPRVLVVTNFCPHYRVPLFELLHEQLGAEFVFFSQGTEKYWQPHLEVATGRFPHVTVSGGLGFESRLCLNTSLLRELRSRDFDVMIKCMTGRTELPMSYAVARSKGSAVVLWTGMWMHPKSVFHRFSHPIVRQLYSRADAIVTYGRHVSDFVVSEGAAHSKVFIAENAANLELYGRTVTNEEVLAFRQRHSLGESPVVLAVSRLVRQKGLEYLIEALGTMTAPRPILVVIGTGDLGPSLERLALLRGVPLKLVGGVRPKELPPAYAASRVFVMPSITTGTIKETWGLACNEAMSQGIPVVATSAVGAAAGGLVVDGVTGLVVPERDETALAAAIGRLLSQPGLATELGSAGKARVQKTNYSRMADGFRQAVEYAMAQQAGRIWAG